MGRLTNGSVQSFNDYLGQPLSKGDIVLLSRCDGGLVRRRVARTTAAGVWVCLEAAPMKALGVAAKHSQMIKINILLNHNV